MTTSLHSDDRIVRELTGRAVMVLGIGQCINWGVLYYAFAVLVVPIQRELDAPTWMVTGAFSLALLLSALLAPVVGRWGDRGRAPLLMEAGGLAAGCLLIVWMLVPGVSMLYLAWAGLGACMAATLYEPAFVIVGRAFKDPAARLRGLALVTLFGGLASSVFLPLTAILVEVAGWRSAVLVLAGALIASTCVTRVLVFRHLPVGHQAAPIERGNAPMDERFDRVRFAFLMASFMTSMLASAAFTSNLVPALGERGVSAATAAMLGGLFGVTLLPGRALLMSGVFADSPGRLVLASMVFQGVGLEIIAFLPSLLAVAVGIMIFATGAGLTSVVRPYIVHQEFGSNQAGYLNGRLARAQQLGRAAGPIAVAWLAESLGYSLSLGILGILFGILTFGYFRFLNDSAAHHPR